MIKTQAILDSRNDYNNIPDTTNDVKFITKY